MSLGGGETREEGHKFALGYVNRARNGHDAAVKLAHAGRKNRQSRRGPAFGDPGLNGAAPDFELRGRLAERRTPAQ